MKTKQHFCSLCGHNTQIGHAPDCLYAVLDKKTEPDVKLPAEVKKHVNEDSPERRERSLFYMPLPNTLDDGLYVTQADLVKILRANKNNAAAIQYIADMLE